MDTVSFTRSQPSFGEVGQCWGVRHDFGPSRPALSTLAKGRGDSIKLPIGHPARAAYAALLGKQYNQYKTEAYMPQTMVPCRFGNNNPHREIGPAPSRPNMALAPGRIRKASGNGVAADKLANP